MSAPSDVDLAAQIGITPRTLRTIRGVESHGNARAVRFEVHLWRRHYPATVVILPPLPDGTSKDVYNTRADAIVMRGKFPYTPRMHAHDEWSFSRVAHESDRSACDRARRVDAETAVRCSSWGLYQELGASLLPITPGDANADVAAFDADPESASAQMLRWWFIGHPEALHAAQTLDWDRLALFYNGPSQVKLYASALRNRYAHEHD